MLDKSELDEIERYIDGHYGTCERKQLCHCMRTGVSHLGCPYWTPIWGQEREYLIKSLTQQGSMDRDGTK